MIIRPGAIVQGIWIAAAKMHDLSVALTETEERKMMEKEQRFCQCCGMPMGDGDGLYGTNADGSKNADYCSYCFEKGAFKFQGTMEEMIEICIPHMVAANPGMGEEEARKGMHSWFPTLKRWKN